MGTSTLIKKLRALSRAQRSVEVDSYDPGGPAAGPVFGITRDLLHYHRVDQHPLLAPPFIDTLVPTEIRATGIVGYEVAVRSQVASQSRVQLLLVPGGMAHDLYSTTRLTHSR